MGTALLGCCLSMYLELERKIIFVILPLHASMDPGFNISQDTGTPVSVDLFLLLQCTELLLMKMSIVIPLTLRSRPIVNH